MSRRAFNHTMSLAMGQRVIHVEIMTEASAVDDPQEVFVKGLTGPAFGISHSGLPHLDDDAGRGCDVGEVDRIIFPDVRNFPTTLGEQSFPLPVPDRFPFPPSITMTPPLMGPVRKDTWPAFGNRDCTTDRAVTASCGEGLSAFIIDDGILHDHTP